LLFISLDLRNDDLPEPEDTNRVSTSSLHEDTELDLTAIEHIDEDNTIHNQQNNKLNYQEKNIPESKVESQ